MGVKLCALMPIDYEREATKQRELELPNEEFWNSFCLLSHRTSAGRTMSDDNDDDTRFILFKIWCHGQSIATHSRDIVLRF